MKTYKYLIVGGGMAAHGAVRGIREIDKDGEIGLIGEESHPPYKRPYLSKKLWLGKTEDSVWFDTEQSGVSMHLGRKAIGLDPASKRITDDKGDEYSYQRLLFATGGTPRRLLFTSVEIIYLRFLDDYRKLRELTQSGDRFAVIGGGFIGSEIAAALSMNNKQVFMVFPEDAISDRMFPRDLAEFLNGYYRDHGVEVFAADTVMEITPSGSEYVMKTGSGREIAVDGIVAGVGIDPSVGLAESAGLTVENGIVVDEMCRTANPDVCAAGDVANFYNPLLGKRVRVEHEDNAITQGEYAGRTMAGQGGPYHYLPYFYSDLFDLGYEAVGELDSRLQTFADWKEPFREGVIYYLNQGRVRGVLLWNVWDKVPAAREVIADSRTFSPEDLKGRIA
ncbi:MAG: FAD-dependent oxidoreductase [Armatimonadetes bacterium]|nr:FAD-dependent oxidoreductase [Armatimonadota bacterium]